MHLKRTVRAGLAGAAPSFPKFTFNPFALIVAGLTALALTIPAAAPAQAAATKASAKTAKPATKSTRTAKPAAKTARGVKPVKPISPGKIAKSAAGTIAVGKTPTETVSKLIKAMQRRDEPGISSAFNWERFTSEMNKLLPPGQGLDKKTYEQLLVATLNVEPAVSNNLRVGQETRKGPTTATVEMRRVFPAGTGGSTTSQIKTINVLSLGKEKDGWRIYRLDTAQTHTVPAATTPPVPRVPQGMVPAAGAEKH